MYTGQTPSFILFTTIKSRRETMIFYFPIAWSFLSYHQRAGVHQDAKPQLAYFEGGISVMSIYGNLDK